MTKIISFIVPSYNVELYLQKCLDSFLCLSVLNQLEVIVVDDGSQDRTSEIAQSYIRQYPDTYVLLQKQNGGHGSAINEGSKAARGKYFKVIDADDWVVTEHLPAYIQFLEDVDADAVLTPYHMVDIRTGEKKIQRLYIDDASYAFTPDKIADDWKAFDRCTTFHGVTYRTIFYKQFHHKLPEHIFYEDQVYATIPLCNAQIVMTLNLIIYQYMVGNDAQSVSSQNQVKRIGDLEQVIFHMLDYGTAHMNTPCFSKHYWFLKLEGVVLSYYVIMCILNPDKAAGRRNCAGLNRKLKQGCPSLYAAVRKKYYVYILFNRLHTTQERYEALIHAKIVRLMRHNHKVEKE